MVLCNQVQANKTTKKRKMRWERLFHAWRFIRANEDDKLRTNLVLTILERLPAGAV